MKKQVALEYFGGSVCQLAEALNVSPQAVYDWPDILPRRLVDRVIAACVRTGRDVPQELVAPIQQEVNHG